MITLADTMVADGHTRSRWSPPSGPRRAAGRSPTGSRRSCSTTAARICTTSGSPSEIPWTDACIKQSFDMFDTIVSTEGYVLGGSQGILATGDDDGADPMYTRPADRLHVLPRLVRPGVHRRQPPAPRSGRRLRLLPVPDHQPRLHRGRSPIGADVVVMLSDTPAARSFMTYLASARAQETWIKLGGFTSVNRSVVAGHLPGPGGASGGRGAHRRPSSSVSAPAT